MLLIGHRGCHYPGYNQNTLRAFEKVVSEGVKAIEFDVQLTKDSQLVIVHNLKLEEVSTGHGEVASTDSQTLRSFYAGDPDRGKDRIPFLFEVFDFFASIAAGNRPSIHLELKGNHTGELTGKLFSEYVQAGKLLVSDILVSSFNWQELREIRRVCPEIAIALLDGAIRRTSLLEKVGVDAERYFDEVFAYGCEEYMLPRYPELQGNLELIAKVCPDEAINERGSTKKPESQRILVNHHFGTRNASDDLQTNEHGSTKKPEPQRILVNYHCGKQATCDDLRIKEVLGEEIKACLAGAYYNDSLLDTAVAMKATSVNLWFQTVSADFIKKAHKRGLQVFVYTINNPEELLEAGEKGVDGIFTDYFIDSAAVLMP